MVLYGLGHVREDVEGRYTSDYFARRYTEKVVLYSNL